MTLVSFIGKIASSVKHFIFGLNTKHLTEKAGGYDPAVQKLDWQPYYDKISGHLRQNIKLVSFFVMVIFMTPSIANYFHYNSDGMGELFWIKFSVRAFTAFYFLVIFLLCRSSLNLSLRQTEYLVYATVLGWILFYTGLLLTTAIYIPADRPERVPNAIQNFFGTFSGICLVSLVFPLNFKKMFCIGIAFTVASAVLNIYAGILSFATIFSYTFFLFGTTVFSSYGARAADRLRKNDYVYSVLLSKKNELLKKELLSAREIQRSLLPPLTQKVSNLDIDVLYWPCEDLSGDFIDVFQTQDGVILYVADVTSHGAAAAQVTYILKSIFKSAVEKESGTHDLKKIVKDVADHFSTYNLTQVVTLFACYMKHQSNKVEIITSNFPSPILLKEGQLDELDLQISSTISGGNSQQSSEFIMNEMNLDIDQDLFVFTDGAFEIKDVKSNQMITQGRFYRLLKSCNQSDWKNEMLDKLAQINGSRSFSDDITVVRVKRLS